MKILWYECRKILNGKMLLFLMLFTMLFYNMFMGVVSHPDDSASCDAQNDLVAILKEEYGYSTFLPYEDFGVVEKIRQEQIRKLDVLVQESAILKEAGITSYGKLRAIELEEMAEDVYEEMARIDFEDGIRQVFLKQHIESLYEMMEFHPIMGVENGKEIEAADTFLSHSEEDGYSKDAVDRVAGVIKENQLSLLPVSVLFHLEEDFPKFGVLLLISCLLLILPYQVKERQAGVNPLFAVSNTGRELWRKRYRSALVSCFGVCILQFLIFCAILAKSDILQYWNYSVNGNGSDFYWLDMNLGSYLILKTVLYSMIALGVMTVFYLISRLSANYIVGTAVGVPTVVLFGILTINYTKSFLNVTKSIEYDLMRPIGFTAILLGLAVAIVYGLRRWDQRRDIFV